MAILLPHPLQWWEDRHVPNTSSNAKFFNMSSISKIKVTYTTPSTVLSVETKINNGSHDRHFRLLIIQIIFILCSLSRVRLHALRASGQGGTSGVAETTVDWCLAIGAL